MFTLKFDTDNAAFADDLRGECVRILRRVAQRIEDGEDASHFLTVFDFNGNDVGRFKLTKE